MVGLTPVFLLIIYKSPTVQRELIPYNNLSLENRHTEFVNRQIKIR